MLECFAASLIFSAAGDKTDCLVPRRDDDEHEFRRSSLLGLCCAVLVPQGASKEEGVSCIAVGSRLKFPELDQDGKWGNWITDQ